MSIRTYIFALLTSLMLMIAVILSFQSASLFLGTFQMVTEKTMLEIGQKYPEGENVEQKILDYHVTTYWQKVPQPVRNHFPIIPKETEKLHVIFIDWIYIAPPEKAYSLMVIERDGKQVYVSRFKENLHEKIKKEHGEDEFLIDPMVFIILVGISVIVIFIVVLLSIFKKVALPMESLQQWARKLTLNELDNKIPDFRFKELNALAALIHSNLTSVAESIEREQAFLGYASHELRTPIAVIRSNSALLEKINPTPSEKERLVRDRIERASLTMKSMTETLLWLSREGDMDMPIEQANLGELVITMQNELDYLLTGKDVIVTVNVDGSIVPLAVTPSVIVLSNVIRNAFQHTQKGFVTIDQIHDKLIITNVESEESNIQSNKGELGFGLGMQLVEKLTKQFGWQYAILQDSNGYQVTISFSSDL